jgi:hypothetical protein
MAFPAETTEAFLEGHNQAFAWFGGVARTILYDNTKVAVAQILGDGTRLKTRAFAELQSHYLFAERFGRPGKGNDKGKVDLLVADYYGLVRSGERIGPQEIALHNFVQAVSGQGVPPGSIAGWQQVYNAARCKLLVAAGEGAILADQSGPRR